MEHQILYFYIFYIKACKTNVSIDVDPNNTALTIMAIKGLRFFSIRVYTIPLNAISSDTGAIDSAV